jgi:hypothetical protein
VTLTDVTGLPPFAIFFILAILAIVLFGAVEKSGIERR